MCAAVAVIAPAAAGGERCEADDSEEEPWVEEKPRRPTRTYELLGNPVVLCEGDAVLANTGWKTWAGSWILAKHLEGRLGTAGARPQQRFLDLSCGTGLAGIALALAGHEVVLTDLEMNVPTIRANMGRNKLRGKGGLARAVSYAWGSPLPEEMRCAFDVVCCGDLIYHVWSGKLHSEFLGTLQHLQMLHMRHGGKGFELLFGFQVRSGRQEQQVIETAATRMGLLQEELALEGLCDTRSPLSPEAKYRLVRLRAGEEVPGR